MTSRDTLVKPMLYINDLKLRSKHFETSIYPTWWAHDDVQEPVKKTSVQTTIYIEPLKEPATDIRVTRQVTRQETREEPSIPIVYKYPKKMVDEIIQTDAVDIQPLVKPAVTKEIHRPCSPGLLWIPLDDKKPTKRSFSRQRPETPVEPLEKVLKPVVQDSTQKEETREPVKQPLAKKETIKKKPLLKDEPTIYTIANQFLNGSIIKLLDLTVFESDL